MNSPVEQHVLETERPAFQCPGESRPISRAVHLARLAGGHSACQNCTSRGETGWLPQHVVTQAQSRLSRQPVTLIRASGIRGLYINQLTREHVGRIVQHILELEAARRLEESAAAGSGRLRVLTGYDSRPSSPDLAIGMVTALKQWGCEIADIGQATRPIFDLACGQLRPHIGIFLTGGNKPAGWNGLDIVDSDTIPWTSPGMLSRLDERLHLPTNRISRTPGIYETLDMLAEYDANISRLFHALRPLRIAITCANPLVRQSLKRHLEQSPCSVHFLTGAPGQSDITGLDRRSKSLVDTLCDRRLDLGFQLGEDGQSCRVFDEGGYELALEEILKLLTEETSSAPSHSGRRQQTEDNSAQPDRSPRWLILSDQHEQLAASGAIGQPVTLCNLLRRQREERIPVLADQQRRFWFLGETPACDAIQTIARVLEVLSLSERPASAFRADRKQDSRSRL